MKTESYRRIISFLSISILFLSFNVYAQKFTATADRSLIGQFDRIQVYFTFDGVDVNGISNFRQSGFGGLKVLSGPNQSTSMQIINGSVSGSIIFSYIIQPAGMGEFTVGAASIDYKGKTYHTDPLKIKVEKGTPQQQNDNNGGYSQQELAKNVFIIAEANKTKVQLGEQITVTYKLYTKLNIASPQITKMPTYEGFWAEEVGPLQNINFEVSMYKGERYRVAKIKQVALFPSKTGTLTVTPFELNVPVVVKKKKTGNDVFDEFFNDSFFGRTETVEFQARSNTLKVDVEPLPQNAPSSFNGAVGIFDIKGEVDKHNVVTNESLTLRLSINGTGNIKLLKVPEPTLPTGFDKYEPKTVENINRGAQISGQKIIDYLIIPRSAGEKEIPPVEFTYYNPAVRKFVTLKTAPFKINVRQGVGGNETATSGFSKEDVKLLSEDIRYIKTSAFDLEPRHEINYIKGWVLFSIFFPLFGLIGAIAFKKKQDKLSGNIQLLRFRKAEKTARKRLKLSKEALDAGNISSFYSELSFGLFGYLENKLGIQKSEFTLDGAVVNLISRKIDASLINRVKLIAEKCEFARFAPNDGTSVVEKELYEEAMKVIVELDSSIDARK
jgi:BatD DUF11 like domain